MVNANIIISQIMKYPHAGTSKLKAAVQTNKKIKREIDGNDNKLIVVHFGNAYY